MNSVAGMADGIYQHWIDGILKVDVSDRAFLGLGSSLGTGWNIIGLGGNANNNYKQILSNYTWSVVNYNGATYKCIQSHISSASITPLDTNYWELIDYNSSYGAWSAAGLNYQNGSYVTDAEQWYAFDDIVVSTTQIPVDYVLGETDVIAPAAPSGLSVL
ncbi:MAG: hypothetical protein US25_C0046G0005 [Candidatus Moranbacteria bacterium GW2011_GWE1_36_7]|nr:MAG: hypothetical protein UR99_C0051G0005 [Candidatus Moranbacteria bacterium GW2011_GWD2_36_12]KKQ04792.1 MAG: hypothetical protein US16_C0047G0005 [Candidatus Moranbacteria bacterium GW2011_GWE2_36_40]KKQ12732.1 MAG: hypothetical protein US25_C0046G0005 [Candidatus Moranbacteria bacterium GW2011_GWE1_36_7]